MHSNKRSKKWNKKNKTAKKRALVKTLKFKNSSIVKKGKNHAAIGFIFVSFILLALFAFSNLNSLVPTSQFIKGKVVDRVMVFTRRGSKTKPNVKVALTNDDIVYIAYSGQKHEDIIEFEIMKAAITNARVYQQR
ncbi:hypothetical protein ACU6U9_23560 [Pseudomonas sp. HK3]